MTASELMEILKELPPDTRVKMIHDGEISDFPEVQEDDGILYIEGGRGYVDDKKKPRITALDASGLRAGECVHLGDDRYIVVENADGLITYKDEWGNRACWTYAQIAELGFTK